MKEIEECDHTAIDEFVLLRLHTLIFVGSFLSDIKERKGQDIRKLRLHSRHPNPFVLRRENLVGGHAVEGLDRLEAVNVAAK